MSCKKNKYPSKASALLNGLHALKRPNCNTDFLRAYYCQKCHAWHLTSKQNG